ncbi:hypothetical protein C8R45DRAFT_1186832 [Mycena sanguinolenta]|nr:hypothetical protein C8R45DRAFT_1186832 [Mycena sanguinolenta]
MKDHRPSPVLDRAGAPPDQYLQCTIFIYFVSKSKPPGWVGHGDFGVGKEALAMGDTARERGSRRAQSPACAWQRTARLVCGDGTRVDPGARARDTQRGTVLAVRISVSVSVSIRFFSVPKGMIEMSAAKLTSGNFKFKFPGDLEVEAGRSKKFLCVAEKPDSESVWLREFSNSSQDSRSKALNLERSTKRSKEVTQGVIEAMQNNVEIKIVPDGQVERGGIGIRIAMGRQDNRR